jgi:hypothetical protein
MFYSKQNLTNRYIHPWHYHYNQNTKPWNFLKILNIHVFKIYKYYKWNNWALLISSIEKELNSHSFLPSPTLKHHYIHMACRQLWQPNLGNPTFFDAVQHPNMCSIVLVFIFSDFTNSLCFWMATSKRMK